MGDLYFDATVHFAITVHPPRELQELEIVQVGEEIERILWNAACGEPWRSPIANQRASISLTRAVRGDVVADKLLFLIDATIDATIATKQIYAFATWISSVSSVFASLYGLNPRTLGAKLVKISASHEFKSATYCYHKNPALEG